MPQSTFSDFVALKKGLIFRVKCLLADDSQEIKALVFCSKNQKCLRSAVMSCLNLLDFDSLRVTKLFLFMKLLLPLGVGFFLSMSLGPQNGGAHNQFLKSMCCHIRILYTVLKPNDS